MRSVSAERSTRRDIGLVVAGDLVSRSRRFPLRFDRHGQRKDWNTMADAAIGLAHIVHDPAADRHLPIRDGFQPGDHPQQRRFPAAGRTDKNHELAVGDLDRLRGYERRAKRFYDLFQELRPLHPSRSLDRAGGDAGDEMAL